MQYLNKITLNALIFVYIYILNYQIYYKKHSHNSIFQKYIINMEAVRSYRFSNTTIHMMKGAPCYDYIHNNKHRKHRRERA